MHALSTPPAFVLSQDQTLRKFICDYLFPVVFISVLCSHRSLHMSQVTLLPNFSPEGPRSIEETTRILVLNNASSSNISIIRRFTSAVRPRPLRLTQLCVPGAGLNTNQRLIRSQPSKKSGLKPAFSRAMKPQKTSTAVLRKIVRLTGASPNSKE